MVTGYYPVSWSVSILPVAGVKWYKEKNKKSTKEKKGSKIITENNKNWTKIRVCNKTMCLLSWNRAYIYNKINICKPLLKVYI